VCLPAAGYRDDSNVYNVGDNGNYWSSTPNDKNNAYNLNFNDSNVNPANNNNRNYGYSVRLVYSAQPFYFGKDVMYDSSFTFERLLNDLHTAYLDARRHKRNKDYQLRFEARLEDNLLDLCCDLWWRTYKARPSECFIITDPKRREVFAADFRDRIVHHLYYNYIYRSLVRTFIADSYSCIEGRGTLFGIRRLERHIRQESLDYTRPCQVLQMDIKGYFMHIDRTRLLALVLSVLDKRQKRGDSNLSDAHFDFLRYLSREIISLDPLVDCHIKGCPSDWEGLPKSKSLFGAAPGLGLPIGNLTSQMFSNVYLNELDQFMKRELRCRHYGRYVDDFYVVSSDREWLRSLVPQVRRFLKESLGLAVQEGKTKICDAYRGVQFLGAYLKPRRSYVANTTMTRMNGKIDILEKTLQNPDAVHLRSSLSSMMGLMRQHNSYRMRQQVVGGRMHPFTSFGHFDQDLTKFIPDRETLDSFSAACQG